MTNNRTTELLCKLLEERGVSCQTDYLHVVWRVGPKLYDAVDNFDGTLTVSNITPEQAIAATLGSEREAELVRAMEDVLRHSTDTVWVDETETLVDRMVSLGVYGHEVYESVRPWEVGE